MKKFKPREAETPMINDAVLYRNRVVHLFGAGFAQNFGGPSSGDLTKILRVNNAFTIEDSGNTLGEWLFEGVISSTRTRDPNFEDMLQLLNEMWRFSQLDEDGVKEIDSILYGQLKVELEIKSSNPESPLYSISNILELDRASNHKAKQIGLVLLWAHKFYLKLISKKVRKYEPEMSVDSVLKDFGKIILGSNLTHRLYSLNYDEALTTILKELDNKISFDGFRRPIDLGYDDNSTFESDPLYILQNDDNVVSYNLHGSIHWGFDYLVGNRLGFYKKNDPKYIPLFTGLPQKDEGYDRVVSNIVAGYGKLFYNHIPPRRQYFLKFEQDLMTADIIVIYGFSFGDLHVTRILESAILVNKKVHLIVVNSPFESSSEINSDKYPYLKYFQKFKFYESVFYQDNYKEPIKGLFTNWGGGDNRPISFYSKGVLEFLKNSDEIFKLIASQSKGVEN